MRGLQKMALLALLAAALLLAAPVAAMFPGMGGNKPPPKVPAVKADIPFIKCQVCEAIIKQAREVVKDLRAGLKPKQKLSEADILDRLEKMCDPDTDEGEWISRFDIQESKDKLVLKDMGVVGECNAKCRTIARACESIVESADLTDLSEALYSGSKRAELTQTLCYGSRGACVKKPPAVPNGRPKGEAFVPMSDEKRQAAKLMRTLKASGMSGTMYDRASLQDQMSEMAGDYDDDGEMAGAMKGLQGEEKKESESLLDDVKESVTNVVDSVKDAAGKAASAVSGAVKSTLGKLTGSGKASDDEL